MSYLPAKRLTTSKYDLPIKSLTQTKKIKSVVVNIFSGKSKWFLAGGGILLVLLLVIIGAVTGGHIINQENQNQENCDTEDTQTAAPTTKKSTKKKVKSIKVKTSKNHVQQLKNIANAVAPVVGVKARLLFAQLYQESGATDTPVNKKDHNYAGMTYSGSSDPYSKGTARPSGEGGNYRHYKNVSEFAGDWAQTVKNNFSKVGKPKNVEDYAHKMKQLGYYTASESEYVRGMQGALSMWSGKSTLSGAAKVADDADSDTGEDCDTDAAGSGSNFKASGDILKEAAKWKGKFKYSYARSANAHWKKPSKNDTTDCSGFVWLVLKRAGYKVPSQTWSTPTMESDAKGSQKYLKKISAKNAKKGDIIIVNVGGGGGQSGHTAILIENYKGNSTHIIEMGGDSRYSGVNVSTIATSFTSLLGSGRTTFARAIKK